MNDNQTLVCPRCKYDANPNTAIRCQICNHSLKGSNSSNRKSAAINWLGLLVALLWLSGALYFFRRYTAVSPTASVKPNSTSATSPQPLPPTSARLNSAPDLQFYNTMQDVPQVPDGLFNYNGAHTFAAFDSHGMNAAISQAQSQFRLRYTEPGNNKPGSGTGIAMLLDGLLSFSQSGRPLEDAEYGKAKARGFSLEQVAVAIDGIVFYTHPGLNIAGLSLDQVQAIFMGKVTNWKQVGGPDLPIKPFAVDPKLTSSILFLFEGIEGASLGANVQIERDYTEIIRQVSSLPGGISYGSAPLVKNQRTIRPLALAKTNSRQYVPPFLADNQVNAVAFRDDTYPLTRRLFVVFRHDGTPDEKAGVAYANLLLTKQGQQIIEKAGFVPLR